jgi:hypothetical protein
MREDHSGRLCAPEDHLALVGKGWTDRAGRRERGKHMCCDGDRAGRGAEYQRLSPLAGLVRCFSFISLIDFGADFWSLL